MAFLDDVIVPAGSKGGFLNSVTVPVGEAARSAERLMKYQQEEIAAKEKTAKTNSPWGLAKETLHPASLLRASGVPQMATDSFNMARDAYVTAGMGESKSYGLKEGFDVVAGVGGVVFSPLAPVINPVSQLIQKFVETAGNVPNYLIDASTAVGLTTNEQRKRYIEQNAAFAGSDAAETAERILEVTQAAGGAAMALLGGAGAGKVRLKGKAAPETPISPIENIPTAAREIVERYKATAAPERFEVSVPKQPTALEITQKGSRVERMVDARVAKSAADINTRLVEQGFKDLPIEELALYSPTTKEFQIKAVSDLMTKDLDAAINMARTGDNIPAGVKEQVIFNAVEKLAIETNNAPLLRDLAKSPVASRLSAAAQELGSHAFNDNPYSPVQAIREIVRVRESQVARTGLTEKVVVRNIRKSVQKGHTKDVWGDFVKSIQC